MSKVITLNDEMRAILAGVRIVHDNKLGVPDMGKNSVVLTSGVDALPPEKKVELLKAVAGETRFPGDTPEHDFGAVDMDGQKFFWKIDYYDPDLRYGSDDPSNPKITRRVLTVMRSEEY